MQIPDADSDAVAPPIQLRDPPVEMDPDAEPPVEKTTETETGRTTGRHFLPSEIKGARESRRFIRNLTVWLLCALLMIAVLWMLLMKGPISSNL